MICSTLRSLPADPECLPWLWTNIFATICSAGLTWDHSCVMVTGWNVVLHRIFPHVTFKGSIKSITCLPPQLTEWQVGLFQKGIKWNYYLSCCLWFRVCYCCPWVRGLKTASTPEVANPAFNRSKPRVSHFSPDRIFVNKNCLSKWIRLD